MKSDRFGAGIVVVTACLVLGGGCSQWLSKRAMERGTIALKQGDYATAAKQLEKAARTITDSADLYYNLGTAQQRLGNLDAALKAYQTALDLRPSDTTVMLCIGDIHLKRQNWEEATAVFEKAGQNLPPSAEILTALAQAAEGVNRADATRLYLLRALQVDRTYAPALYNLGCLYRDKYMLPAEAMEQFELFLRAADPKDPHAAQARAKVEQLRQVVNRLAPKLPTGAKHDPAEALKRVAEGDRFRAAKQMAKAEKAYRDALVADPLCQDAAYNIGLLCRARNNLPEAMRAFQRAAALESVRAVTLIEAAQTAILLKDYPTANRMLDRAIARNPTSANPYASLALVRIAEGRKADARLYAEQFVRLAQPSPDRDRYEAWAKTLPR